jgi:hypothetical protein
MYLDIYLNGEMCISFSIHEIAAETVFLHAMYAEPLIPEYDNGSQTHTHPRLLSL